jgi:hypothetical protein
METELHYITVKTSEEDGYTVCIQYEPAGMTRSRTHSQPEEYGEDRIISITHEDGTELESKEVSALGITDYDFKNITEVDLTKTLQTDQQ